MIAAWTCSAGTRVPLNSTSRAAQASWITVALKPRSALARVMADPETINQFRPVAVYGVREARAIARAFNQLIGEFAEARRALSDSKTEIERQNRLLAQTVTEQIA